LVKGRALFPWLVILAVAAMVTQSAGAWAQSPRVLTVGVLAVDVPGTERFWRLFRDDMWATSTERRCAMNIAPARARGPAHQPFHVSP